jgi:alkanesulfonate monooxygenase SsuD/methylene tetrahydromethanopterin reductase-like flavin-dependent oxidoreductase (luciferase family)
MLRFGVFDHMDRGAVALSDFFADRLVLVEAYDTAGFYGYHVAEHHATPLGLASSPSVWLSAVAQRTRRLRFGPLVYTLPLYHPLRVIDEICMLDQMSRGRLLLGVGRGISPIELDYWGVDHDAAPSMYQEALEVVLRGLATSELSFAGRFYRYERVPIELEPFQRPRPPLWYGIGRPESLPWAARNRVNIVSNLPPAPMRALTDRYRAEWAALGHAPSDLPFMGVSRHVVVAETEAEALEVARPAYRLWRSSFMKLWLQHGQLPAPHAIFPETFEEAERAGRALAGTPATLRDRLHSLHAESGVNYVLCRFAFGDMPREAALRSVALFAREVMPAFGPHDH